MKLKGKILATMLAISMLASVAVTPVFAAEPSRVNQEEHAVSSDVPEETPQAPTDETTNTPAIEPPAAEPPAAEPPAAEPPAAEPPAIEPPAAEPSAPETQAAEPTISSNMKQVEISAVGETKFLVVGVESTGSEKPPLFFLCDDESIAELSDTYITSLDDFQYVPGFRDLSQEEQQQLQAQSMGNYVVTVTGLQKGTTVINVLTDDGSLTKDIPVLVEQAPASAPHINIKDLQIDLGETVTLQLLDYDGDPSMLMWYPVNEDGSMWEGLEGGVSSIPIDFVDAEDGPPTGLTAKIMGIGGGTMPLSVLDMSRATEEELNNAQTQEEMEAIFRKCRIDTCMITGIMHMTGVKINDSFDMNKVDPSVTVYSVGGATSYAFARAEPANTSDQKPIVFETADAGVAKVVSSKKFTVRDMVRILLTAFGALGGNPFVTEAQIDAALAEAGPQGVAQMEAEIQGLYVAEIQGVGVGSTTVTAKTEDNAFVSTAMPVTVLDGPATFELSRPDPIIPAKAKAYLDISWTPSDFDPKDSANGIDQYQFFIQDADGNLVKNEQGADLYVTTDETLTADQKTRVTLLAQKPGVYQVKCYAKSRQKDAPVIIKQFQVTVTEDHTSGDSITFDKTEWKVLPGSTGTLTVEYPTPLKEGEDATLIWQSSNPKVATVNPDGTITAVGTGTATIIAKSADRPIAAACQVTVDTVQIEKTLKIDLNTAHQLAMRLPDGTPYTGGVTWKTSNAAVATVDDTGLVTSVGYGTCTITATAEDGSVSTCAFTTNRPLETFTLNITSWMGKPRDSLSLSAQFHPADTTDDKTVTWSSSDKSVATVSSYGSVTAVGEGDAVITATHVASGKTATCTITVRSFGMEGPSTVVLEPNASQQLRTYGITQNITWTSSNPAAVTVSSTGLVTSVGDGSSTITATAPNGQTATCTVRTAKHVQDFTLDKTAWVGKSEEWVTLYAQWNPSDITDDKAVTWASSDERVATVNYRGTVTAVSNGHAVITATHVATGKTATCAITVRDFRFDQSKVMVELAVPQQLQLVNSLPGTVTWTSSNPDVFAVDETGAVTAADYGSATITATAENGETATCTVQTAKHVETITLDKTSWKGKIGETLYINGQLNPSDTTDNKTVTWSSSDERVATVNYRGRVTAVGNGHAVITATHVATGKTATCDIVVQDFRFAESKVMVELNESKPLDFKNSLPGAITWTSSNPDAITVDETGKVTSVGYGSSTITVTAETGEKATCTVQTHKHVETVTLDKTTWRGKRGAEFSLSYTLAPSDTTDNKKIVWTSSDEKVATVSSSGRVTAVGNGHAVITVTHEATGKAATCDVTVRDFQFDQSKVMVELAAQQQLNLANTLPDTVAVTWTSSNPDVITVDATGKVTSVDYGSATITATAENGETATCTVQTHKHVETVTLDKTSWRGKRGAEFSLSYTLAPLNTTDSSKITWTSSDETVATVNRSGRVTAVGDGHAVITANHADSGKAATCDVTVRDFQFDQSKVMVELAAQQQLNLANTLPDTVAVTWTSSNPDAMTVDATGKVTSVGYGSSTITATSADGDRATCEVTTKKPLTSLAFSNRMKTMKPGGSTTINTTRTPTDTTETVFHFTSSDPSVATVNEQGSSASVKAVKNGVTVITATSEDGALSASCLVVVNSSGTLNTNEPDLAPGMTKQLTFSPYDGVTGVTVQSWSSDTPAVATVDANGLITAVANGTAKITVSLSNGEQLFCQVRVIQQNTGIRLNKSSITIEDPRNFEQLLATISPSGSQDKQNITWKSSKESVANVTSKGVVIPMRNGTTTITATVSAVDGSTYRATCLVTVQNVGELSPYTFGKIDEANHTITLAGKLGTNTITNPVLPSEIRVSTKVDLDDGTYRIYTKGTEGETYRVTAIGEKAFPYYGSLLWTNPGLKGKLTLPRYLERIEKEAFYGCDFTGTVEFPDTLTYIGDYAFKRHTGTYATNPSGPITIPDGVTYIGEQAFYKTDFSGPLVLPSQLTYLGDSAFAGSTGFTGGLTIPGGLTYFGREAFSGCTGLNGTLTLEEGLTSIGSSAFYNCRNLTGTLTLGEGLISIGSSAFYNCRNLTGTLTIPRSVEKINTYAFQNCVGFSNLTLRNPSTLVDETVFDGCNFPNKP